MANSVELKAKLAAGEFDERLKAVYLSDEAVAAQKTRDAQIIDAFVELFGDSD